ncbi:DUF3291 domain-containing protein [Ascidiaceihabitans sp.]|nr:DUF3291 domain-containing protein [Ascidiaceihabitans sp.]
MRLAELNVGYAAYPLDDPRMSEFMDNLETINALAERSPGFVWRMKSDSGNATDISVPGDTEMISNMSVWEDVASLGNYVFNTVHAPFYKRKEEWFQATTSHHFAMWMVEDNHTPDLAEAMDHMEYLQKYGSTDHAFGWDFVDQSAWWRCTVTAE